MPGRTPTRTSPETDWTLICPSRIAPIRWSPETVLAERSFVGLIDREVARDERCRDRTGDRAEADVAGDRLHARFAVDRCGPGVSAGRLHAEAGDVLDGDVAGGRLHLDLAEPAGGGDVGGCGRAVEVGAFRAADADTDLRRAAERDPGRTDAEAHAADADLDRDLVAVQLDCRPLDRLAGGVVVAERLELDRRAAGLARIDRDQAGRRS